MRYLLAFLYIINVSRRVFIKKYACLAAGVFFCVP